MKKNWFEEKIKKFSSIGGYQKPELNLDALKLDSNDGKSNPEIAEELYISPRTVTTHVSNILNKTDSANRAEAATYASQNGLLKL